ncbi:Glycosyl transferase family 2 [Rubritalea squalenifaciens DSM 18772]|uniref:Glycosyl transferase family 2 n=1 Tax=Rubritalea squalenifaciens DSM 18772 TaxID=1123071 RepID=A0A1M6DIB3_9BACT|nr:glycosyltransferase family 2 protein [Rubritalea squalenifaciens]SHI72748.1 Glycosyl transferase family 2 [Rubritalea squalenifaciens DSM 18772]
MSRENPLITIVTPSYNYSEYIEECLESVKRQQGVEFEHLIFDAGSTDGTLDIIRKYEHVKLVVEPDKGMSDAINKGFQAAKGKWVMWLNTDDRLKPDALLRFKDFAERHPEADVIYGAWDFIDKKGGFMRTMQVFPFKKLMLCHYGCYIGSTSTFLKRETTISEGHLLNIRFKCVMDGEYYNRLAALGKKFIHFPRVLADFRMHGENISQRHFGKDGVDEALSLQLFFAESRAIRRVYGICLFKSDHLNCVVDCILFYLFKMYKLPLKLLNQPEK